MLFLLNFQADYCTTACHYTHVFQNPLCATIPTRTPCDPLCGTGTADVQHFHSSSFMYLIKIIICSEVVQNLFYFFYYLEMLLQVKKHCLFILCKNSTTSLRHSQFLIGSYVGMRTIICMAYRVTYRLTSLFSRYRK